MCFFDSISFREKFSFSMKVISRIGMEVATRKGEKGCRKGEKRKIEERVSLRFSLNDLKQKLRPTLWSWLNDDNGHGRDPLSFPRGCVFRRSLLFATVSGEHGASACQFRFERFTSVGLNKQPRIHRPGQLACSRNTIPRCLYQTTRDSIGHRRTGNNVQWKSMLFSNALSAFRIEFNQFWKPLSLDALRRENILSKSYDSILR